MKPLIILPLLFLVGGCIFAQPAVKLLVTSTVLPVESTAESDPAQAPEVSTAPKIKNPLAAGRAGHPESPVSAPIRHQLPSPRYKNLERSRVRFMLKRKSKATRRTTLKGPRYKNRGAKTGN